MATSRAQRAAIVVVLVLAAAQLVRPDRTNPTTDARRTIAAHAGTTSELTAVLDRSCRDCHSNNPEWPWYTHVAPLSWVWAHGVAEGRRAVNFSEWTSYTPQQQQTLLEASCLDASGGRMPESAYTLLRPAARLSAGDVETICAAARQARVTANAGRSATR